jgi:hypothetical protein
MFGWILISGCALLGVTKPPVVTFKNSTNITIILGFRFSDQTSSTKILKAGESYKVVNFAGKMIQLVAYDSSEKDENGNLYGHFEHEFKKLKKDETYTISLKKVPERIVPAGPGTESFTMPETQTIISQLASTKK